jgi:hypothetical protein
MLCVHSFEATLAIRIFGVADPPTAVAIRAGQNTLRTVADRASGNVIKRTVSPASLAALKLSV